MTCNQPYYDEHNVCEVREVKTGQLIYRGNGIHGPDHSDVEESLSGRQPPPSI